MPAYVIADIEVHDPAAYEAYRQRVPATVAAQGGRYVARGGATRSLEGTWSPRRLVILELPSLERFQAWWDSPEYQARSLAIVVPKGGTAPLKRSASS